MNKYIIRIILATISILTIDQVIAQDTLKESHHSTKLFTDGYFKFKFGTNTIFELSPALCYQITPDLSAGIGLTYQYYQNRFDGGELFKTHNMGFRLLVDYRILKNRQMLKSKLLWYAHLEQEFMNLDGQYFYNPPREGRHNTTNTLLGLKCKYPALKRLDINMLILWNIYQSGADYNLNKNPIIKFGVNYKFSLPN